MKNKHRTHLIALFLALFMLLTPVKAHAATPLTVGNFNATRYASENPDLKAAFGTDAAALWAHYVNFGAAENRKAYAQNGDIGYLNAAPAAATTTAPVATDVNKANFDYKAYADKYPDLKAAFGYNQDALYNHYVSIGKSEGRTTTGAAATASKNTTPTSPAQTAPTVTAGSFNYVGYADKYPDLKAVFGYDAAALYNHYVTHGQKEGRTVPAVGEVVTQTPPAAAKPVAAPVSTGTVFASVIPNSMAILGDSISTFQGLNHAGYSIYYPNDPVTSVSQMWWAQVAGAKGLTVVNNCSWSGSTVLGDANQGNSSAGCSWRRITDLAVGGQAPAVIVIMLGTNDFQFSYALGNHRVGEPGASSWTFSGAYDIMLTRMKAAFPNSRIVCLSLPMVWSPSGPLINDQGVGAPAFNAKIAEIAAAHGVQMINIYNVYTGGDSIDYCHPNAKGMSEIAAAVAAGL